MFASPKNLAKFSLNSATRCLAYKYLVGSPIHTSLAPPLFYSHTSSEDQNDKRKQETCARLLNTFIKICCIITGIEICSPTTIISCIISMSTTRSKPNLEASFCMLQFIVHTKNKYYIFIITFIFINLRC